ncbi:MAG: hypothetical protein OEO19_06145 [Gammaproteobacteria bacterium]|nr:hypothetical protein [Gammaproteobacteria bacterium]MDH3450171.1 hypothetical protein [Gammaproteobacteria bacterium]
MNNAAVIEPPARAGNTACHPRIRCHPRASGDDFVSLRGDGFVSSREDDLIRAYSREVKT